LEAEKIVAAILENLLTGKLRHVKHIDKFKWKVSDADGNQI